MNKEDILWKWIDTGSFSPEEIRGARFFNSYLLERYDLIPRKPRLPNKPAHGAGLPQLVDTIRELIIFLESRDGNKQIKHEQI